MSKRIPNKHYTGEFKQQVVETMHREKLSYRETAYRFEISDRGIIKKWERIYLEEGAEGLYIERRGRASASSGTHKGRTPSFKPKEDEDIHAELLRLRAEVAYLKNLQALVLDRERQQRKKP